MPESVNSERLFTVLLDIEGTKSAAQFRADSVEHALTQWLDDLSLAGSYGLTDLQREMLAKAVSAFGWGPDKALLDGPRANWGWTISGEGGGIGSLNIVES
jgi:hypothetical protein